MTYWHMQLHPDYKEWERENKLLEKTGLIGCASSNEAQANLFNFELKIDDIVLIKRGSIPIALVKVIGDLEDADEDNFNNLDWFRFRRKVKVLDWAKGSNQSDFPSPRGTITKAIDKKSKSYKYIDSWYRSLLNEFYTDKDGLKLRQLFIENFRMFKNITINLTYPENIEGETPPIPVIVLAGINGTGKTTLLRYLSEFAEYIYNNDDDKSFVDYERYDNKQKLIININHDTSYKLTDKNVKSLSPSVRYFKENILYIPIDQSIEDLKTIIVEYLEKEIWVNEKLASKAYSQLREYINNIFKELDLFIEFDSIIANSKNKEIFFRNKNGDKFSIDEVSTGENTLFAKVLYLYLNEIKNKVILIDEPELSLHPSWQNKILKVYENFAKTNNCQIIIATHSPHIIGSAKNEYLRVLTFNDENNVEVISEFSEGYGLEFSKVLTNIMGMKETRTPDIAKKIGKMWGLLENEDYKTEEYKKLYNYLKKILGSLDQDLVLARLEIAKLEASNA